MEITEKTRVRDILSHSQSAAKVFKKRRLDCLGCRGLNEETVAQVARNNGIDPEDLVKELRESVKAEA